MSEYAVLPLADYVDACEATREMTGGTEKIPSGELAGKIRSINTQEDLSAEMTAQDGLIEQIQTALVGKAAGSGSVETCTVTLTNESWGGDCSVYFVSATVFENGERRIYATFPGSSVFSITIPNVVCGTAIALLTNLYYDDPFVSISGSATFAHTESANVQSADLWLFAFNAPTVAGENCTIEYGYNA